MTYNMKTSDFDYNLPTKFIAQEPMRPRDHSKLLVLDRKTGQIEHKQFFEIVDHLGTGDVLVFNDTKVFRARLIGNLQKNTESTSNMRDGVEVFLLREEKGLWECLLRPGRKVRLGNVIDFGGMTGEVIAKRDDGIAEIKLSGSSSKQISFIDSHGQIPTPPYIEKIPDKLETYQTVYAKKRGSVAAPTAGFHFTEELINKLKDKGVAIEFITLHVGLGTFQSVKEDTFEEHAMHVEFAQINKSVATRINKAKREGRRIIACGTTTCRALEGVATKHNGKLAAYSGDVDIFIMPGFQFQVIDGLITNFHLPKSTLIALVSALTTRENILNAYEVAKREGYRFYSFGDAMVIV